MKEYTEQEILVGCAKEDKRYQRLFFERYYSKMFAICARFTSHEDEAKDLLQEGFIKAFEKLKGFNGNSSLSTWLSRIMINNAIDFARRKNKNLFTSLTDNEFEITEEAEQTEDAMAEVTPEEALSYLKKLPVGYRTILNLYAIDGLSHKQIGELLGISEGTSKSQLSKGRALLKKMISTEKNYVR